MDPLADLGTPRQLEVVGVNHHTAPIEIREQLAVRPTDVPQFVEHFKTALPGGECVIVSTCNRVEVYLAGVEPNLAERGFIALCEFCGASRDEVQPYSYIHDKRECVQHLFRVATSLDSMVVGEAEILGQGKQAYAAAVEAGGTGKILNSLFQRAFSIAKDVRTKTAIGRGHVSVASVAVDFTLRIFSSLADKTVLSIGAGEAAEGVLKSLVSHGATAVLVANRTYERAVALSNEYERSAIRFDQLQHYLGQADIIIGSSAAPHVVVTADQVREARRQRRNRPMLFLDISSPRDIDPDAGQFDNVYLYDLDDLKDVVEQHLDLRYQEVVAAQALVESAVDEYVREFEAPDLGPSIAAVRTSWHDIRTRELERTLAKLNGVSDTDRQEISYLTERIVNKLLNQPLREVKNAAAEPDGHHILRAFHRLLHHDPSQGRDAK